MKAKKIKLLISLVALIATFTSFTPQILATNNDDTGTCVLSGPAGDDDHISYDVTVINGDDIRILATVTGVGNRDNLEFLVITILDVDGNPLVPSRTGIASAVNLNAEPLEFMGTIFNLPDGIFKVVGCYVTDLSFDEAERGVKHGDVATVQIDTTAPECTSPENVIIPDPDSDGVPRDDPVAEAFEEGFACDDGDGVGLGAGTVLTLPNGAPIPDPYPPGTTTVRQTCFDQNENESFCDADLTAEAPAEKACDKENLDTEDDQSDKQCISQKLENALCGVEVTRIGANGQLELDTVDPNELSGIDSFDIRATGTDDVTGVVDIFCNAWTNVDGTIEVISETESHITDAQAELYGSLADQCEDRSQRFAELVTGEEVTAFLQMRATLLPTASDFSGPIVQDIFVESNAENCGVPGTDLDSENDLPGFGQFDN